MYSQIRLLGKDGSRQVIHLSDKFGIEDKKVVKSQMSPAKCKEIADEIGWDIMKANLFSVNLS